jgi:hypothetical protein
VPLAHWCVIHTSTSYYGVIDRCSVNREVQTRGNVKIETRLTGSNLEEEEGVGDEAAGESGLRHVRARHRRVRHRPRRSFVIRDPPLQATESQVKRRERRRAFWRIAEEGVGLRVRWA